MTEQSRKARLDAEPSDVVVAAPRYADELSAELARLMDLHDSGSLTDDGFAAAKRRLTMHHGGRP